MGARSSVAKGELEINTWWEKHAEERFWLEVRKVEGIGTSLYCPIKNIRGQTDSSYELVGKVRAGDIILHWNVREQFFCGWSKAASDATVKGNRRVVVLQSFQALPAIVGRADLVKLSNNIQITLQEVARLAQGPTYGAVIMQSGRPQMRSNYFGKLPAALVDVIFGTGSSKSLLDGRGFAALESKDSFKFLKFKAKNDGMYKALIETAIEYRTRAHETLVNEFAHWLEANGCAPCRNRAVDIGLDGNPQLIVEAKDIKAAGFSGSVRAAVGQLNEYRYFLHPGADMMMLSSKPLPSKWIRYLERDQNIGVAWRASEGFEFSPLAQRLLETRIIDANVP